VATGADEQVGVDQRRLGVGAIGHAAEQPDDSDGPAMAPKLGTRGRN
jgi:hypothetical protein